MSFYFKSQKWITAKPNIWNQIFIGFDNRIFEFSTEHKIVEAGKVTFSSLINQTGANWQDWTQRTIVKSQNDSFCRNPSMITYDFTILNVKLLRKGTWLSLQLRYKKLDVTKQLSKAGMSKLFRIKCEFNRDLPKRFIRKKISTKDNLQKTFIKVRDRKLSILYPSHNFSKLAPNLVSWFAKPKFENQNNFGFNSNLNMSKSSREKLEHKKPLITGTWLGFQNYGCKFSDML